MLVGRSADNDPYLYVSTTNGPLQPGAWYHLVGVFDYFAGTMSLYIDGELSVSGTVPFAQKHTANTAAASTLIGARGTGLEYFFDGQIDEVRLSDVARSADWISAQYDAMVDRFLIFAPEEHSP
jgi:hypothetical protein